MTRILVLAFATLAASACSGHRPSGPLTVAHVRSSFGSAGLPLHVTVDYRTLTERKIVQLTRLSPHDGPVERVSKERERAWLELALRGAAESPVVWLSGKKAVSVIVWPLVADAQAQVATAKRFAPGHVAPFIVAVRNVVVISDADAPAPTRARIARAIGDLRAA